MLLNHKIKIKSYIPLFAFVVLAILTGSCYYVSTSLTTVEATYTPGSFYAITLESPTNSTHSLDTSYEFSNTSTTSTTNLPLQYEFPEIRLIINYPADWEKIEYGRAVKAYGEGLIANFFSAPEAGLDKFREFVQLRVENLTPDNLQEASTDNNYIGDNPIYQTVFDRPNLANKSDSLTTLKTWTPLNDKTLVVEFSALKSEFAKSLPLALEIINSVQINGVGVSSTTDTTNQSSQLPSNRSSSQDKQAVAEGKNTQTTTIIERLLERGINISETHAD